MYIEDDGALFINKLKLEEKERHVSLEKLDQRVKRAEERAPGSAAHIKLLHCYLDQWMRIS
jgi:hypothetical protein